MGVVIELGVKDVQRTIDFYTKILCSDLVNSVQGEDGQPIWAEASLDGTSLMFERADVLVDELPHVKPCGAGVSCAIVLRLSRECAEALLARLIKAQVKIDNAPHETAYGTYEYALRDPDGYVLVVAGRG